MPRSRRIWPRLAPDAICVAAYGCILPREVLEIPRYDCLNVHASLLPRWRGAAPIERAILAGDEQTGVCIMRMEEGLDTGPYCVRRATEVEGKSAAELTDELANLGARALLTGLSVVEQGGAEWTFQDDAAATYAEKLAKDELYPDPAEPAAAMVRKVLASSEAHPARAVIAGRSATVERVALPDDERAAALCDGLEQGAVRFAAKRLFLGTGDGAVEVLSLKPDGKKSMDARASPPASRASRPADARGGASMDSGRSPAPTGGVRRGPAVPAAARSTPTVDPRRLRRAPRVWRRSMPAASCASAARTRRTSSRRRSTAPTWRPRTARSRRCSCSASFRPRASSTS